MAGVADPVAAKHTLSGSCHCGAIKILVQDLDLSGPAGKCNCSYCMITDNFYARVDDGNLLIYPSTSVDVTVDTDTGYAAGPDSAHVTGHAINHANISTLLASNSIPEQLKMYRFNNHIASHLFCGTCATRIATVGDFGAKFATVNLRILDLSKAGLGATDLSEPSKVKYADGKNDFKTRVGEPFPGGCW